MICSLFFVFVFCFVLLGTVIGLLKLARTDPHLHHKGSHASTTHTSYADPWFEEHETSIRHEIENGSINEMDTLGMQPLYRNFLLQELYSMGYDDEGRTVIDDTQPKHGTNFYQYVSVAYGSWIPPKESNDTEELEVMEAPAIVPEIVLGKGKYSNFFQKMNPGGNFNSNPPNGNRNRRLYVL